MEIMRALLLLGTLIILGGSATTAAQPLVVTSIRPLQLLAMAVTDGVSEPLLVLDGTQDPHHPALKPSQRRAMNQADIFLWIGPGLETDMENVAAELDADVLTVQALPGVVTLKAGAGNDPHLWLDTRNAARVAQALAEMLAQGDTANARTYFTNLQQFQEALVALESEVAGLLGPGEFPSFAVYHNGYQYFESQFGLAHAASFTENEEVLPGIRQVMAIKAILEAEQTGCIVVHPGVNTGALDAQLERPGMRYITIDVLANDIPSGRDAYVRFMRGLAAGFAGCRQ